VDKLVPTMSNEVRSRESPVVFAADAIRCSQLISI